MQTFIPKKFLGLGFGVGYKNLWFLGLNLGIISNPIPKPKTQIFFWVQTSDYMYNLIGLRKFNFFAWKLSFYVCETENYSKEDTHTIKKTVAT
jgi:hypothetical protein